MRHSTFLDRFFGALVLLAFLMVFTAVAFALVENEPRVTRSTLLLHSHR